MNQHGERAFVLLLVARLTLLMSAFGIGYLYTVTNTWVDVVTHPGGTWLQNDLLAWLVIAVLPTIIGIISRRVFHDAGWGLVLAWAMGVIVGYWAVLIQNLSVHTAVNTSLIDQLYVPIMMKLLNAKSAFSLRLAGVMSALAIGFGLLVPQFICRIWYCGFAPGEPVPQILGSCGVLLGVILLVHGAILLIRVLRHRMATRNDAH